MSEEDGKINALFGSESDDEEYVATPGAVDVEQAAPESDLRALLESDEDGARAESSALEPVDDFRPEDDDDNEPAGPQRPRLVPETWQAPLTSRPRQQLQLVNFKSLLDIESRPFNPEKFELEDSSVMDEMGRRRSKPSEINKLRWRWTGTVDPVTGSLEQESNARFVRWSDGSLQLQIGDDFLDVSEQDIKNQNLTLYVLHSGSKLLQAQAQVNTRFLVKPHGLNSRFHRNIAHNLSPVKKQPKVKMNNIIRDYERDGALLAQQEEARLKMEKRQDKVMKRSSRGFTSALLGSKRRGMSMTAEALETHDSDYDEDEGDEYTGHGGRDIEYEEDHERRLIAAKREAAGSGDQKRRRRFLDDDDDDFDTKISDDDVKDAAPKAVKKRLVIDDEESE